MLYRRQHLMNSAQTILGIHFIYWKSNSSLTIIGHVMVVQSWWQWLSRIVKVRLYGSVNTLKRQNYHIYLQPV